MIRTRLFLSLVALAAITRPAVAGSSPTALPVFAGDPVDPSSDQPYTILPGVPSIQPGKDKKLNTGDDVIDPGTIGDVDVVVRTGGTFLGASIPSPAEGVTAAPRIVPGGTQFGAGTEVTFQVVVSDGASSPAAGHPLLTSEHDGRGALLFAFPDLDGDGFIGPTSADGNADNQIERQETMTIIGRQVAPIENGVASGALAVALGAPASSGGLGVVVTAGVLMGASGPKYFDGPWVSTLLPILPPLDPDDLIGGGGTRPPEAGIEQPIEVKLEFEKWFSPAPNHPQLGTPLAIPTDGSSVTVDLLRAESGPAAIALLGIAVDPATFTAAAGKRLLPAVSPSGQRQLVERLDSLTLADDGSASKSLLLFGADLLGNPADPPAPMAVTLEAGSGLRILAPDGDGDPLREVIPLSSANGVAVTIGDAGGSGDRRASVALTAVVGGIPTSSIAVLGGTGSGVEPGCGNGVLEAGEACDDGGTTRGDGCSSKCQHEQVLGALQQKCVNAMNKGMASMVSVQAKQDATCLNNGLGGASGTQACLISDSRGKVASASRRVAATEQSVCQDVPSYGYSSSGVISDAGVNAELGLMADLFGADVGAPLVPKTDELAAAKCQLNVTKAAQRVSATELKLLLKCKKDRLKGYGEQILSAADLESCFAVVMADGDAKLARAVAKLNRVLQTQCAGQTTATLFPGTCAARSDFGNCVAQRVSCRMCRLFNSADAVSADCDLLDDGLSNASCSQFVAPRSRWSRNK